MGSTSLFNRLKPTIPASTTRMVMPVHSLMTKPSASAAAGGCSVFVTTIRNIASDVASAPNTIIELLPGMPMKPTQSAIRLIEQPATMPTT